MGAFGVVGAPINRVGVVGFVRVSAMPPRAPPKKTTTFFFPSSTSTSRSTFSDRGFSGSAGPLNFPPGGRCQKKRKVNPTSNTMDVASITVSRASGGVLQLPVRIPARRSSGDGFACSDSVEAPADAPRLNRRRRSWWEESGRQRQHRQQLLFLEFVAPRFFIKASSVSCTARRGSVVDNIIEGGIGIRGKGYIGGEHVGNGDIGGGGDDKFDAFGLCGIRQGKGWRRGSQLEAKVVEGVGEGGLEVAGNVSGGEGRDGGGKEDVISLYFMLFFFSKHFYNRF